MRDFENPLECIFVPGDKLAAFDFAHAFKFHTVCFLRNIGSGAAIVEMDKSRLV